MTSNTAADGTKLTYSGYTTGYYPWLVTNYPEGGSLKNWEVATNSAWIQFEFPVNVRVQRLAMSALYSSAYVNKYDTPISLIGYTSSGTSTQLGSGTFPKGSNQWNLVINNNNAFKSIRIQISGYLHHDGSYITVRYIELFGWKLT